MSSLLRQENARLVNKLAVKCWLVSIVGILIASSANRRKKSIGRNVILGVT